MNDINAAAGNGLLAGGYTKSIGPNQRQDIFVLRTDSLTDYLWTANFEGASLNAIYPANNSSEYGVGGYSTNAQSGTPYTGFMWIGTSQPGAWLPNYCPFYNFNGRQEVINDVVKVAGGWCAVGTSEFHAPGLSSAVLFRLNYDLSDCNNTSVILNAEEDKLGGVKLYPNPTTGVVRFNLQNQAKNLSVIVYDVLGKEVFNKTYNGAQQVEEDFSNLGNGLYQARITADGKYSAQTFVIAQ
ncbi:MAG: T9SS type A sorting domain-containing protein [Sphingobacteriales bacterium JAD_PAG50586_3]|nr:MAG: T9SS type A sorting domain-containing protein [Sphingobacteriales bacterium JAD_PAG50586_3]